MKGKSFKDGGERQNTWNVFLKFLNSNNHFHKFISPFQLTCKKTQNRVTIASNL